MNEVSKFNLFGEDVYLKDEVARAQIMSTERTIKRQWYVKGFMPYCSYAGYYPQGSCYLGNNMCLFAFNKGNDEIGVLQKVDISTGSVVMERKESIYHANNLSYYDGIIYSTNLNDASGAFVNTVTKIDPNTLQKIGEINYTGVNGIRTAIPYNGLMYIVSIGTNPALYTASLEGGECMLVKSLGISTWQTYDIVNEKLIAIDQGGFSFYEFDLNGNLLDTWCIDIVSGDGAAVTIEREAIFSIDGSIYFTDIGYKTTKDGKFNRHILCSFSPNKFHTNHTLRIDNSNLNLKVGSSYTMWQNGLEFPYDSASYAAKVATAYNAICILNITGNIAQTCEVSNGVFSIAGGTLDGIFVDSAYCILSELTVKALGGYNGNACVELRRFSNLRVGTNAKLDGTGVQNATGIYCGYNSMLSALGGTIINCAKKVIGSAGIMTSYGGSLMDSEGALMVDGWRVEQPANQLYTRVGGPYGTRTLRPSGLTLANLGTVTFNAKEFYSPMLSLVVDGVQHVFDYGISAVCSFTHMKNNKVYYIQFQVAPANVSTGSTITFKNITVKDITGTPTDADKSLFPVTAIRVF